MASRLGFLIKIIDFLKESLILIRDLVRWPAALDFLLKSLIPADWLAGQHSSAGQWADGQSGWLGWLDLAGAGWLGAGGLARRQPQELSPARKKKKNKDF